MAYITITECFVIRRKGTDHFVALRGVNHPLKTPAEALPRLFRSRTSAKCFLSQWARGKMHLNPDYGLVVTPMHDRSKADMEILPVKLVFKPEEDFQLI